MLQVPSALVCPPYLNMYCGKFRLDPQWLKVNSETKSNSVNAPHSDEDRRYQVVLDTQALPI